MLRCVQMVSHRAGRALRIPRVTDERAPELVYFNGDRAEDDKCSLHPATSRFALFYFKRDMHMVKNTCNINNTSLQERLIHAA